MRRLTVTLAFGAVLLVAVSGCKASSTGGTAAGGAASGGTHTSSAKTTAAGGGGGDALADAHLPASTDICTLMPPATVAKITGHGFTKGETDNTPSYELFNCNYTGSDFSQMDLSVIGKGGSVGYQADVDALTETGHKQTPISGLGDKAFLATIAGTPQADVVYGPMLVKMSGFSELSVDQVKQLATMLHDKLAG
jgi:hypothetical protein